MWCLRPAAETLGACGGRVEAYPSSLAGAGGLGHAEPTRESRELICWTRGRGSCCHLKPGFRVASVALLLRLKSVGVKLSWLRSPRFSFGLCPAVTMAFAAVYAGYKASTQHTARNTQNPFFYVFSYWFFFEWPVESCGFPFFSVSPPARVDSCRAGHGCAQRFGCDCSALCAGFYARARIRPF